MTAAFNVNITFNGADNKKVDNMDSTVKNKNEFKHALDTVSSDYVEHIEKIFASIGRRYGYDFVSISLNSYKEFKARWTRSPRHIEFQLSDYLVGAPDYVFSSLAESIFSRICNDADPVQYTDEMTSWILDPSFSDARHEVYAERHSYISNDTVDPAADLDKCFNDLKRLGLIKDEDVRPHFYWGRDRSMGPGACSSSLLMNACIVNDRIVDNMAYLTRDLLRLLVFKHILDLRVSRRQFCGKDSDDVDMSELKSLPNYAAAREHLHDLGLRLS